VANVVVLNGSTGSHKGVPRSLPPELDDRMRRFVEQQETMVVATYDERGEQECTFKLGPPGFVRVLDVNRLAWPEYADDVNVKSVAANPDVSLVFPNYLGQATGLQVHGTAKVLDDRSMRRAYRGLPEPEHGVLPEHWITVYVEEVVLGDR
jgi:Pyridoxamine 5'-phosphate oxidase